MVYLILIGCERPESATILTGENGVNQEFDNVSEANEVVIKMNVKADKTTARAIAV